MYEAIAARYSKEECTDCDGANPCSECDELSREAIEATIIPNYEPMEDVNDTMVTDEGEEVSFAPARPQPIVATRFNTPENSAPQKTEATPLPPAETPENVSKKEEEDNSKKLWMWVGIGVGVLILIVMLIAILKKK